MKNDKIYLVIELDSYNGDVVYGVYTSKEEAQKRAEVYGYMRSVKIVELEVNKPIEQDLSDHNYHIEYKRKD